MEYNEPCYIAESVRKGHPDKICDQISDALVDSFLKRDENCHTAIECLGTKGHVIIAGEVSLEESPVVLEEVVKKYIIISDTTMTYQSQICCHANPGNLTE